MKSDLPKLLVLTAALGVVGCGSPSSGETWTESVKLENGEVIKVVHEEKHGQGEAGVSGGPLTYSRLEFDYRGVHYKWESNNTIPSILQIDKQGRPVIASDIGYEWAWRQRGSPCDKGVVEYFENGAWHQIPSWEIPVGNFMNLAADKEHARRGIAYGEETDRPHNSHWNFEFNEERCKKVAPEDSVGVAK